MKRTCLLVLLALVAVGCDEKKPSAPPAPPPAPAPEAAAIPAQPAAPAKPAEAAPAVVPAPAAQVQQQKKLAVEGLEVEFLPDGKVVLKGNNVWGDKLDTTYEDYGFFSRAVPVLERSVTPKQAEELKKLAKANPAALPGQSAEPPPPPALPGAEPAKAAAPAKAAVPAKAPAKK